MGGVLKEGGRMTYLPLLVALAFCSKDKPHDEALKVTLDCEGESVLVVLAEIRRQTGVAVEMDEAAKAVLDPLTPVRFKVSGIAVEGALRLIFQTRDHRFRIERQSQGRFLISARECARLLQR
jgi:hypothetical protein